MLTFRAYDHVSGTSYWRRYLHYLTHHHNKHIKSFSLNQCEVLRLLTHLSIVALKVLQVAIVHVLLVEGLADLTLFLSLLSIAVPSAVTHDLIFFSNIITVSI